MRGRLSKLNRDAALGVVLPSNTPISGFQGDNVKVIADPERFLGGSQIAERMRRAIRSGSVEAISHAAPFGVHLDVAPQPGPELPPTI